MAILQIAKIQHRSGNLIDLPQLDEAEFGWATDAKRLFIGKTAPNENIEVLTSYSTIEFSQIDGSIGNLNINPTTVANGQPLVYDGTSWVNRGGNVGGLVDLGEASNVKIDGGSLGYVLQTDGSGNLSWTPKSTIIAFIENVTKADPAVVTTTEDNFFTDGAQITITDPQGMSNIAGQTYYANVLTANTFSLYTDSSLTSTLDSTGFNAYSYTSVTATTASTNQITVGNSAQFTLNSPIKFVGNIEANSGANTTNIFANTTYYVKTKPSGTALTISDELLSNGVAGNTLSISTVTSLSANVYQEGGRLLSLAAGSGTAIVGAAAGVNTCVQYNNNNIFGASADFTFDFGASPKILTVNGNANVSNLNANGNITASRFISNVTTGTAPLVVTSTTQVANLNVATSGTAGTVTTNAQPNITSVGTLTDLTVTGNSFISTTGGNVGIGTITPTFKLDIVSNANSVGSNIRSYNANNLSNASVIYQQQTANVTTIFNTTQTQSILGTTSDHPVQLIANNVNTITLAANNNVGIGNSAPSHKLSIDGTLNVSGNANVNNLGTTGIITATGNITGGNLITSGNAVVSGNVTGGNLSTTGVITVTGNANVGNIGASEAIFTGNANVTGNTNITGNITVNGTVNLVGSLTSGNLADAVGYKGLPQSVKSANYTLELTDIGKHISISSGNVVIPANSVVSFPIGSSLVVFNNNASTTRQIQINTDTLRLNGTTTTGNRTLAVYGIATLIKVNNTVWVVTGAVT